MISFLRDSNARGGLADYFFCFHSHRTDKDSYLHVKEDRTDSYPQDSYADKHSYQKITLSILQKLILVSALFFIYPFSLCPH